MDVSISVQADQETLNDQTSPLNTSNTLSKRAQRKAKRKAHWDEKKLKLKLQKKAEKEERRKNMPHNELDMSPEAILLRKERNIAKKELFLMAAAEGIQVVIDCGFEHQMVSKEKKSLSQQIMFSYGINRKCSAPMTTYLTSLHGETLENLNKISGFQEWLAFNNSKQCYIDIFKKESLVYLTADSPTEITELCHDKVYIIGGIVDRNRLKGVTYKKAMEQGIATARLPLDKYIDMGQSTKVLTVNHVFEILTRVADHKDWASAAISTLPERKSVQLKES